MPAVEFNRTVHSTYESLWITLNQKNSKKFFIGLFYRPPRQDINIDNSIFDELRSISKDREVLIIGDFNAPNVDWSLMQASSSDQSFDQKLLDFTLDEFLFQQVNFDTRYREGQRPSCLDLIFTKDEEMIADLKPLPAIGLSDHYVLCWECIAHQMPRTIRKLKRNIWKADLPKMRQHLQTLNWSTLLAEQIDQSWMSFRNEFNHLINNYCPLTTSKSPNAPKWMNSTIKSALKKKKRAWKLARMSGLGVHQLKYRQLRNECKLLIKRSRISYDTTILENAVKEPKRFYGHLNSKLKVREHIPCLKSDDGNDVTDDAEKAHLLSNFFKSVFTIEDQNPHFNQLARQTNHILQTIEVTENDIRRELQKLKPHKSGGLDEIPSRLLKLLADDLVLPISTIFRQSLESGRLPSDWKTAVISPIYKGGPRHSPNSFRPISLTCICCKILERIIKRQILSFLENNHLLTDAQHGFRANRSCLTNLLLANESWTCSIDAGYDVDVIFIDFKKAFDSVPHQRLLHKLEMFGINGLLLQWLRHFLTDRTQRVQINGCPSKWEKVTSGVPQGSVLGPLLFLIFVNDIPQCMNSDILLFADDVKIWRSIKSPEDPNILQNNLNILQAWSENWLLQFNTTKCAVITLSSRSTSGNNVYKLDNKPLKCVENEKDLGIMLNKTLKPSIQCANAAKNAMSMMRRIKRAFPILSPETFLKIYPTFVRSHLEYGIQAWRPWLIKDKVLLENVQRRSTKLVSGLYEVEFRQRESLLNLFPLSYRQDRGDLIVAYKIMRQNDFSLKFDDFFHISVSPHLRGHPWKLSKARSRLLMRQSSFSQRIVNLWNSLPDVVVFSPTLRLFKLSLDKFANDLNFSL
jgi:hypothetical protein